MAAFFGDAAFLAALGLAALAAFFGDAALGALAAFGFLAAGAFLTLGVPAALAFFGDAAFLAAAGFVVAALVFGFTCLGFLVAFAALAFLGFSAEVELADLTADSEAAFLAFFGPGDFEAARFLVAEPVEALFFGFLVAFFLPAASLFGPNLNEPLAPLPLVCLKYCDLTPFFNATFKCWLACVGSIV